MSPASSDRTVFPSLEPADVSLEAADKASASMDIGSRQRWESESEGPHSPLDGVLQLDEETCERLEIEPLQSGQILTYLCSKLGLVLWQERRLDVQGFGTFRIREFRPALTGQLDFSVVECPYIGPVEFAASPVLLRQLETRQLDNSLVARCDALYAALRDEGQLTRGRIPILLKGAFQTFTQVLVERRLVTLPTLGTLYVRTGPPNVRYDSQDKAIRTTPARLSVALRIHPSLLERFPWRRCPTALTQRREDSIPEFSGDAH